MGKSSPRIIGLLTGKLVAENRQAEQNEDKVFMAAESLTDSELIAFSDMFRKYQHECKVLRDGSLSLEEGREDYDVQGNFEITNSSNDLEESWGAWETKLRNIGIVSQYTTQKQWKYREDSDRHIDEDGIAGKIVFWLNFSPACPILSTYVERVKTMPKSPAH